MIERFRVQNFKAIKDADVRLGPLTVFIGANDSGKSSCLEALYALTRSTRNRLSQCFWSPWESNEIVHWQAEPPHVRLSAIVSDSTDRPPGQVQTQFARYGIELAFRGGECCVMQEQFNSSLSPDHWQEAPKTLEHASGIVETSVCELIVHGRSRSDMQESLARFIGAHLQPATLARWNLEDLATPSCLTDGMSPGLDPSGYGLPTFLATLKLYRYQDFQSVERAFCRMFPEFREISFRRKRCATWRRDHRFRREAAGQEPGDELAFVRADGIEVPSALASGGVLVSLAFLSLALQPEPTPLLLIEEPENGLHPGRLSEIVDLLRGIVNAHPQCQVVMTTHSPLLLDHVQPEEVRVFTRDSGRNVAVHDLDKVPDIADRLKYMQLGELVVNEGEEELVKEIRQHAGSDSG